MSEDILVRQDGPALHLTLNRAERGNGVSDEMARELTRLVEGAHQTADFVVLRGAGADFCTGRWVPPGGPSNRPEAYEARRRFDTVFNCYGAFRRSPVPVIGVVQGRAHGLGCALAALCDMTIASETARFCVPEMRHAILPTMVASALADRVPLKALMHLVYSTEEIGPERALAFGLVTQIVPAAGLDSALDGLCAQLRQEPRAAILGLKEFARSALRMDTQGMVDFARNLHATINASSEMRRR